MQLCEWQFPEHNADIRSATQVLFENTTIVLLVVAYKPAFTVFSYSVSITVIKLFTFNAESWIFLVEFISSGIYGFINAANLQRIYLNLTASNN